MSIHKITIYSKPDCKLCDIAADVVQKVVGQNIAVLIEKVDITADPECPAELRDELYLRWVH